MQGSSSDMPDTGQTARAVLTADGQVLLEQVDGSYRPTPGTSDWARVDAVSEVELAAAIADDPEDPGNDPTFFDRAELVHPSPKARVRMQLDRDVLAWFRSQGRDYQSTINAVLRAYVAARKSG
jgi:uncharacterized protein (DUF4415 family)